MTLQEWIDQGGNMISNRVSLGLCQCLGITEGKLRRMDLSEIFVLDQDHPEWFHVEQARREISRFARDNNMKLEL